MSAHLHQVPSGLRQRLAAIGARVVSVTMTGSEDRGAGVGHVPVYTLVLARDDERTLTETISTGQAPYNPDTYDVFDTLLCAASLFVTEGMGGAELGAQVDRLRHFLDGPACWEDWIYYTDRDPGRQDDYDH